MNLTQFPIFALATVFAAVPALVNADDGELDEAEIFFELNDTDGDLGIHAFADGDAWEELEIEAPYDRELMKIDVKSRLKRQGVTELFFESAEPCFPEECDPGEEGLSPERFFKRFPQGWYEIEVETLEGEELESEIFVSHVIPAAPEVVSIGGTPYNDDDDECTQVPGPVGDVEIVWEEVTTAHEDLGRRRGMPLGRHTVIDYEFVVEVDEEPWNSKTIVQPEVDEVSMTVPKAFFDMADAEEYKFEILVRVDNGYGNPGNKSAVEGCFEFDL